MVFYPLQQIESAIKRLQNNEEVDVSQLPPVPTLPAPATGKKNKAKRRIRLLKQLCFAWANAFCAIETTSNQLMTSSPESNPWKTRALMTMATLLYVISLAVSNFLEVSVPNFLAVFECVIVKCVVLSSFLVYFDCNSQQFRMRVVPNFRERQTD